MYSSNQRLPCLSVKATPPPFRALTAKGKPFRIWVGGETMYSSNQRLPCLSVKVTPPSFVGTRKPVKALSAARRYSGSPVSRCARTKSEIPCPCASPEYQGAFKVSRYSQSKLWFQIQTSERLDRKSTRL